MPKVVTSLCAALAALPAAELAAALLLCVPYPVGEGGAWGAVDATAAARALLWGPSEDAAAAAVARAVNTGDWAVLGGVAPRVAAQMLLDWLERLSEVRLCGGGAGAAARCVSRVLVCACRRQPLLSLEVVMTGIDGVEVAPAEIAGSGGAPPEAGVGDAVDETPPALRTAPVVDDTAAGGGGAPAAMVAADTPAGARRVNFGAAALPDDGSGFAEGSPALRVPARPRTPAVVVRARPPSRGHTAAPAASPALGGASGQVRGAAGW